MSATLPVESFALDYSCRRIGGSLILHADSFEWMGRIPQASIHAIVTDPPYGVKEYDFDQIEKRANGNGSIWRIPPSFDGHQRSPLPRFTALNDKERATLRRFFLECSKLALRVLRPGGHVFLASNAFLSQFVFAALVDGGLEFRGEIIRLVRTLRGGDRPKNAEEEFPDVSSMPRGCYEPWGLFRSPPGMKVSDCLREHQTGGLRRRSDGMPFQDVIESEQTPQVNGNSPTTRASSRKRFCVNWCMPPCRLAKALSSIPSWDLVPPSPRPKP